MSVSVQRRGPVGIPLYAVGFLVLAGLPPVLGEDPVIPLPQADGEKLEKELGKGVIGKAVPAPTIGNPAEFLNVAAGRSWRFHWTAGEKKGKVENYTLSMRKSPSGQVTWKANTGPTTAMYLRTSNDGTVEIVSDEDRDEGVVTRYSPPEPLWISNLKPGDTKRSKHDVKVYDLSDPKDVSHRGSLNLVYTYIGAYEVTVPAGTFEAILLRWEYSGKIGPASIEDHQYRLLAKGVGPVALVQKFDASAFLVYQNHQKIGRLLVSYSNP